MGEFSENIKNELIEKYKKSLIKNNDNKYNLYDYFKNNIIFSKSNISPGTSFMFKLSKFLNSSEFKDSILSVCNNLSRNNIIISDHLIKGEGEKKIIDYIDNPINEVDENIYI